MSESRVIKSYVWHKFNDTERCFFVSTIERDSSSPYAEGTRYNETLVWAYDWTKAERGEEILLQEEDSRGSIRKHNFVCEQIHYGNYAWVYNG